MTKSDKGNGRTPERRTGVDRRITRHPAYRGPERRHGGPRRATERAADKPIKR